MVTKVTRSVGTLFMVSNRLSRLVTPARPSSTCSDLVAAFAIE